MVQAQLLSEFAVQNFFKSFLAYTKAVADVCYEKSCVCPVFMAFQADFSTSFNLPVGIDAYIAFCPGGARMHSTMNWL
jgi:hypothetical protein